MMWLYANVYESKLIFLHYYYWKLQIDGERVVSSSHKNWKEQKRKRQVEEEKERGRNWGGQGKFLKLCN